MDQFRVTQIGPDPYIMQDQLPFLLALLNNGTTYKKVFNLTLCINFFKLFKSHSTLFLNNPKLSLRNFH